MLFLKKHGFSTLILCAIATACAACGVRGPLTVNPPPIKGISAEQLAAPASPIDLHASPASHVLHGKDGTKTQPLVPNTQTIAP